MDHLTQYMNVMTDLIKKQMVMIGPNVAIGQARTVEGLSVNDDGVVTQITKDPQITLSNLAKQYMALSGQIAQMTLESLITKYPNVKLDTTEKN